MTARKQQPPRKSKCEICAADKGNGCTMGNTPKTCKHLFTEKLLADWVTGEEARG